MQYSGRLGCAMSRVMRYVLVLCVAVSVMVAAVPAGAGVIRGVVVFTGAMEQKKLPVTIDQYICGKEKQAEDLLVGAQRGVRNAVVWLQTPPPGANFRLSSGWRARRVRSRHRPETATVAWLLDRERHHKSSGRSYTPLDTKARERSLSLC